MNHINYHNFKWLFPHWAVRNVQKLAFHLDDLISKNPQGWPKDPYAPVSIFAEFDIVDVHKATFSLKAAIDPDHIYTQDLAGTFLLRCKSPYSTECQITFPLNPLIKGHENIEERHCLYLHGFGETTEEGAYIGVTKKRWFDRLSQHARDSKNGSPYLFHKAIREREMTGHRIIATGLSYEQAMDLEEEFVAGSTLYPYGLNMIPGGFKGLKYLSTLGVRANGVIERDAAVERLAGQSTLAGRPNPLCAARWESDPEFAESVICGHSGRLTGTQVRTIRTLFEQGITSVSDLAARVAARTLSQVKGVISGKHYSKVQ